MYYLFFTSFELFCSSLDHLITIKFATDTLFYHIKVDAIFYDIGIFAVHYLDIGSINRITVLGGDNQLQSFVFDILLILCCYIGWEIGQV